MKYQSELIKEIVDTRGHKESSLHYESECMETWIEEAKGGYPKLCDYESEWLKYISILDDTGGSEDPEPPIGEFPYVVLSDVTEATIDNVVPYAYKSAILKGHTLVNLTKNSNVHFKSTITDTWQNVPTTAVGNRCCLGVKNIEPNTKYIMKILSSTTQLYVRYFNSRNDICNGNSGWINSNTAFTTQSDTSRIYITLRISENNEDYSNISECANIILLKYQDGMENWDIPYFEGMQSVQMPVLTTSNEDGTKSNILTVNEDVTLRSNGGVYDELDLLTGKLTQRIDENGEVLSQESIKTVDLNIQDQNGKTLSVIKPIEGKMFLSTSSDTIKPLFSGEIPVEAITQNLTSFIDLD